MSRGRRDRREAEALAGLCLAQGFRVRPTRSGYVVYAKDGERGRTVGWHLSPSDHRWLKNTISKLRKIGVEV